MITFYRTPLQSLLINNRLADFPSLKRIFKKRIILNDYIDFEIKSRLYGSIENFITMLILGKQGTFKSSVGLEFGKKTDISTKGFLINHSSFLYEAFNNNIKNSNPKESFILDEQVIMHGSGTDRVVDELQNLIETLRKRQNSMIIIGVEGKYFPETLFTFVMETIDSAILGSCIQNPALHEIRNCPFHTELEHKPEKLYIRLAVKENGRYIGFYIQEIEWNNDLWKQYSLMKDDFMIKATAQDFMKMDFEKIANEIFKNKNMELYKSIGDIKLLINTKYPNITGQECDMLARQIKILRKEKEML